ncbi:unnamed protein product [Ectocarpus fasciculatus]
MVRTIEDVVGTAETQKNMRWSDCPLRASHMEEDKEERTEQANAVGKQSITQAGYSMVTEYCSNATGGASCYRKCTWNAPPEKGTQKRAGCYKTEERITKLEEAYICNHVFLAKYYPSVELSKRELASEQIPEHPQAQGQHVNDLCNRVAKKLHFHSFRT